MDAAFAAVSFRNRSHVPASISRSCCSRIASADGVTFRSQASAANPSSVRPEVPAASRSTPSGMRNADAKLFARISLGSFACARS
jgi:hypothetical protein